MNTEYPADFEMNEVNEERPIAFYRLLDNGKLAFTGVGEVYYRPRLERLGISLKNINTIKRFELVKKLLGSMEVEQSIHKVVRVQEFLARRSVMAKKRLDLDTAMRLDCQFNDT